MNELFELSEIFKSKLKNYHETFAHFEREFDRMDSDPENVLLQVFDVLTVILKSLSDDSNGDQSQMSEKQYISSLFEELEYFVKRKSKLQTASNIDQTEFISSLNKLISNFSNGVSDIQMLIKKLETNESMYSNDQNSLSTIRDYRGERSKTPTSKLTQNYSFINGLSLYNKRTNSPRDLSSSRDDKTVIGTSEVKQLKSENTQLSLDNQALRQDIMIMEDELKYKTGIVTNNDRKLRRQNQAFRRQIQGD